MKKHRTALMAMAIVAAVAAPAAAEPAQKSVFSFRGMTGDATWSAFNGCTFSSVRVLANQNLSHSTGGPPSDETDEVAVFYTIFDVCANTFRFGSGSGSGFIDGSLRSLTVEGTIPITQFDSTGQTIQTTATVIVTLTATGDVTRGENNFTITTPTTVTAVRSVGASTSAVPSGVVVVDGVDLIDGLSGAGTIAQTNGGTVTIFH